MRSSAAMHASWKASPAESRSSTRCTCSFELIEDHDPASWCVIMLANERGTALRPVASGRMPGGVLAALEDDAHRPRSASCGTSAYQLQSVHRRRHRHGPGMEGWRDQLVAHGFLSCWSHPITGFRQTRALGTIAVYRKERGRPGTDHAWLIDLCQQLASTASNMRATQAHLTFQDTHDPLTGLPNRTLFLTRLSRCAGYGCPFDRPPRGRGALRRPRSVKVINDSLRACRGRRAVAPGRRSARAVDGQRPTPLPDSAATSSPSLLPYVNSAADAVGGRHAPARQHQPPVHAG